MNLDINQFERFVTFLHTICDFEESDFLSQMHEGAYSECLSDQERTDLIAWVKTGEPHPADELLERCPHLYTSARFLLRKAQERPKRDIPATNEIRMFFHCRKCLQELPPGTSPQEWAQLEVGWTLLGFQVWCKRHDINVIHMDFEGMKHPANTGVVADA